MNRFTVVIIASAAACGGPDTPTSTGGGSSEAAQNSSSSSSGTTEATGSETGSETTSESSTGPVSTEPPEPDPSYEDCEEPQALIDLMRGTTPSGEVEIDEGWLGVYLCSGVPYFEFRTHTVADGQEAYLRLAPLDTFSLVHPLEGSYPAGAGLQSDAIGTITFLEPVPELSSYEAEPWKHVRAAIVLDQAEWDFAVEVDFIHCGFGDCDCPCE